MSRFYCFKKIDSKEEFDSLEYASTAKIRNCESVWAEMRFINGTCYYYLFVKGEKMSKLAAKLVRQYVMMEECCMLSSQTTKK